MARVLPTIKGYPVDLRLQEFRKIEMNKLPQFIPIDSPKGKKLLDAFAKTPEGMREL